MKWLVRFATLMACLALLLSSAMAVASDDADGDVICTNECEYAHDGDCDDGGPGSDYSLCEYGTDCADCGPRPADREEAGDSDGAAGLGSLEGADEGVIEEHGESSPEPDEDGMLCTNTCRHAHDGDCDDGGPDSDYDLCEYGTDCADCGPRPADEAPEDGASQVGVTASEAESPEPNEDGMLCTNTCRHAHDGDCDDGGPDSDFDLCEYGTDCADCGPRPPQQESSSGADSSDGSSEMICTNTCEYANDGDCDDGGPNSDYDLCEYGTDCNDCGPRPAR